MSSRSPFAAFALLAFTTAACASSQAQRRRSVPRDGLRAEVLGCYALFTPAGKLLDSSFYNSSPLVRLDSASTGITARDTVPGVFRSLLRLDATGRPLDPVDPQSWFGRDWWADSLTDSIRLSFSDGFSGALVILAAPPTVADTMWGRIEEHWDMGPTVNDRGRVLAVRLRCRGAA